MGMTPITPININHYDIVRLTIYFGPHSIVIEKRKDSFVNVLFSVIRTENLQCNARNSHSTLATTE